MDKSYGLVRFHAFRKIRCFHLWHFPAIFVPDSGNLWNMIGFGCPIVFILNNLKCRKGEGKCVHK